VAKNSTKLRRVAHPNPFGIALSRRADDKSGSEYCDEYAATIGLSGRKHEDFGGSSGAPARPKMRSAIGINHLLKNFLDMRPMRCSDPRWPMM